MSKQDKLIIFDTTLRDGEQSPGASMTRDEKVRIAKALERMRVDVIEAGFPIASTGDFEAVQAGWRGTFNIFAGQGELRAVAGTFKSLRHIRPGVKAP